MDTIYLGLTYLRRWNRDVVLKAGGYSATYKTLRCWYDSLGYACGRSLAPYFSGRWSLSDARIIAAIEHPLLIADSIPLDDWLLVLEREDG